MTDLQQTLVIIGSILIPLLIFIVALRPYVKDTVKAELVDFKTETLSKLSRIEGRLDELAPMGQLIATLVADKLKGETANPSGRKNELLEKWQSGFLTYEESLELRDILTKEAAQAEENKKTLIILALLGLAIFALTRK